MEAPLIFLGIHAIGAVDYARIFLGKLVDTTTQFPKVVELTDIKEISEKDEIPTTTELPTISHPAEMETRETDMPLTSTEITEIPVSIHHELCPNTRKRKAAPKKTRNPEENPYVM